MPTSYEERFGKNSELIHAYADDNSPRASEIKHLLDVMSLQETKTVLNVPFEGNLLRYYTGNVETTFADFVVPGFFERLEHRKDRPQSRWYTE